MCDDLDMLKHINAGIDVHVCMRYVHIHMNKYSLTYSHKKLMSGHMQW